MGQQPSCEEAGSSFYTWMTSQEAVGVDFVGQVALGDPIFDEGIWVASCLKLDTMSKFASERLGWQSLN